MRDGVFVRVDGDQPQLVVCCDGYELAATLSLVSIGRLIEHLILAQFHLADAEG